VRPLPRPSLFGSFDEMRAVFGTVLAASGALLVISLTLRELPLPASAPVIAGLVALAAMLGARSVWRIASERRARLDLPGAKPAPLFGTGAAGRSLVRAMLRDRGGTYVPVGLLDDDRGLPR